MNLFHEFIQHFGGRKFLIFIVATGLLILKFVDQSTWLLVCLMYIGGNIADTLANKMNLTVGGK